MVLRVPPGPIASARIVRVPLASSNGLLSAVPTDGPSAGSSAIQTATYMLLSIDDVSSRSDSGPQANNRHCGSLSPQTLSASVCACMLAVAALSVILPPAGRLI